MNYIRQIASGASSWFYASGAEAAAQPAEQWTESDVFKSLASPAALERPLSENYDIAFNPRNLRHDKPRVHANLAAAAAKVGVEAVREAIVERLRDKRVYEAAARQQLDRVVNSGPSVIVL